MLTILTSTSTTGKCSSARKVRTATSGPLKSTGDLLYLLVVRLLASIMTMAKLVQPIGYTAIQELTGQRPKRIALMKTLEYVIARMKIQTLFIPKSIVTRFAIIKRDLVLLRFVLRVVVVVRVMWMFKPKRLGRVTICFGMSTIMSMHSLTCLEAQTTALLSTISVHIRLCTMGSIVSSGGPWRTLWTNRTP